VICDEGDTLEHLLSGFIALQVTGKVQDWLDVEPPKYKTTSSAHSISNWRGWAMELSRKATGRRSTLEFELKQLSKDDERISSISKDISTLSGVIDRAGVFANQVDDSWILESRESQYAKYQDTLTFKPVWLTEYLSERYFFNHGASHILMSATFPPTEIMGKLLGQNPQKFEYHETGSSFPPTNRKVYLHPIANITYKTFEDEIPRLVAAVERILITHPNEKGIIHTVSYKIANHLNWICGHERLIFHDGKNRAEKLQEFKESQFPYVMVSPSMERGVDLPDSDARWCIICKAPFMHLKDKLVSKRLYSNLGNLWYKSNAIQTTMQMAGRIVRSKTDYGATYILDKQCVDLMLNNMRIIPDYFKEAFEVGLG